MADDLVQIPQQRTCFAYVDGTHEYVCPLDADDDPETPGNLLYPRNTTTVAPPGYRQGVEIPVFTPETGQWVVKPDHRGEIGYDPDGNPVMIDRAGDPSTFIPPLSKYPPTPELPPQVIKDVSSAQALIQLSRMPYTNPQMPGVDNLADATDFLVTNGTDRELKIWYTRAQRWYIDNPNVKKLGAAFRLSAAQIQDAFTAAALIEE